MNDKTQLDIATLLAERNQLVDALEVLPDAFVLFDREDRLVICNDRYREVYAQSAVSIEPGNTFENIVREGVARGQYEDAIGREEAWIEERLAKHRNPAEPVEQKLSDGRWLRIVERKTKDGGTVGFRIDISELKQREKNLRISRDRIRATVESALDCIIMIDSDGHVIEFNPAAEQTFGYSRIEAMGRLLSELIIPERSREAHEQGMQHYLTTGEGPILGKRIEVETMRADGSEFMAELAVETAEGDSGVVFIAYLRDITVRLETAQAMREAKERAEEANKAKANFLAMMSHEIRTPLNGVLGILGLLIDTKLDDEQKKYVSTGRHSAEVLLEVINDILDFSKIDAGKLDFEDSEFSLSDLLEGSRTLMEQKAEEKGITLSSRLAEGVFDELIGDTGRIQQVLLNLLSNAVKFTDQGKIEIYGSRVSETPEDIRIRLEVTDSGIGIPQDVHDDLFSEFTMVDNSLTRNSDGTGLGLAISKKIVEMMNGEIGFESRQGEGSTFWFEISLKKNTIGKFKKAKRTPNNHRSDQGRVAAIHRDNPVRILMAEDNTVNQMVTKVMLEKVGYRVDVVSNGEEVIRAVVDLPYDIILMDVSMPEMDGLEATRQIRALGSRKANIPIIALTAHAMENNKENFVAAGMNDYVSKPVNKEFLLEVLERWTHERPWPEFTDAFVSENDPNSQSATSPIIDARVLEQLAEDTDPEMVPELAKIFLGDARNRIERITTALAADHYETIELEAHTLGSSSATFGVMRLHDMMREIEFACQAREFDKINNIASGVEELANDSFQALEHYINRLAK